MLSIALIGFMFVLFVLLLLSVIVWGIGICFTRYTPIERPLTVEKSTAPIVESAMSDNKLDPHELAVITAAVHCVLGDQAHHSVSIRSGSYSWAKEGRREIFTSRRVR